ncbi:MAG: histidine phosphatase family protein [Burkholderiaceae bacterium]
MSILLIRHGETDLNVRRVFQPPETPLSERGRLQARALARRLADMDVRAILSSDMRRAQETAAALAELTGLPVTCNPLLGERNFGDLRGQAVASISFDAYALGYHPPNGESHEQFHTRVNDAFGWLLSQYRQGNGRLAVFTHGLVLGRLIGHHVTIPEGATMIERMDNTAVTEIDPQPPYRVSLLACSRHLSEADGTAPRGIAGV